VKTAKSSAGSSDFECTDEFGMLKSADQAGWYQKWNQIFFTYRNHIEDAALLKNRVVCQKRTLWGPVRYRNPLQFRR
jgi:hypothetical protein